jgi:hypothetical protein
MLDESQMPMAARVTHIAAKRVVKDLPEDYQPYGRDDREGNGKWGSDCSTGCIWFAELRGSSDWGVCMNPVSHRAGLLTFEHQGCRHHSENPTQPAIAEEP